MIGRRQVLGFSGIAGLFGAGPASASDAEQVSDRALADVKTAIDDLRKDAIQQRSFPQIAAVRDQQRTFLRSAGKFPDYIEVGVDVWQGIYDWHILWQQPVSVTRDQTGRYTIPLMGTNVVLRPDMVGNYIGTAYDTK